MPFNVWPGLSGIAQEAREIVVGQLVAQGMQELAAANIFGASLRFAPSLDDKMLLAEQALDELEHFEVTASIYGELTEGADLHVAIAGIADRPLPTSWPELVSVQAHVDRWLQASIGLFPRLNAHLDRRALELGLQARDSASATHDYLVELSAEMSSFGLKIELDPAPDSSPAKEREP